MARNFKVEAVHKQMYPGTYNFKDEADGTSGTDIGFVDINGSGSNCTPSIISSFGSHKKVLQLYDNNAAGIINIYHDLSSVETDITIEFWWASDNVSTGWTLIEFQESGNQRLRFLFDAGNWKYHNGVAWQTSASGAAADTWYHHRIKCNDTANTFDWWIDGVSVGTGLSYFANSTTGIDRFIIQSESGGSGYYIYIDAWGESFDTDYNIGDNCHWRHYKESTDDFESDDVGTQGTSITWVDGVDTAASTELVQEYNEHKKIIRGYYSSAVGGADYCYHDYASQAKTGWFECWWKVSDVTSVGNGSQIYIREGVTNIVLLGIQDSQFEVYTGGAWRQVTGSPTPVNDTWYHIYVQWYDGATDTFDLWIDNVQYEDGTNCQTNQTSGINKVYFFNYSAVAYGYLDAPMSSLDSDERGDNRTFDYNDSYTREDITDNVLNATYENKYGKYRSGVLYSNTEYEKTEVFFQLYDINSKLTMEAEIKDRIWNGATYTYPLRDKNLNDLKNRSSNTFSAAKIHDPSDSTSMLKVILPTVGQADGRLILVNADTKSDTYSPVTKNYPDGLMLSDIGDLADSNIIIEANGKVHLDDDLASGSSLDVDTAADQDYMTAAPIVSDILEDFNYYEIFGAINPDTGERFSKVIDNTGSDEKHPFRITNNEFRTQTDVDNYATKIAARTIDVKNILIKLQGMGTHDMGTTFTYKYDDTEFTIPSAAYYVISEKINFDMATSVLVLSDGIIEESKYAADYERPENYNDSFAAEIYETDIIITDLNLIPESGASETGSGIQTVKTQLAISHFYLPSNIDEDRDLTIDFVFRNGNHGARTTDGALYIKKFTATGGTGGTTIENYTSFDPVFTANLGWYHLSKTISSANITADNHYLIQWRNDETDNADTTICWISTIQIKYYQKRSL